MIVRNEEAQLEACLRSIRQYVAEICIVDTGSNDRTPEIARRYADIFSVYTGCNNSEGLIEDFAKARSQSFSLATQPWVFWIDGDDEVRGAEHLSSIITERESVCGESPIQVMLPYEYSHDANGKVTMLHYRERLMKPKESFVWQNAVHEVITCTAPGLVQSQSDLVTIVHRRDGSKKVIESGRNLRILKRMYEQHGESDARHLYYLGLEYGNNGDFDNALKFLSRYVELSGWDEEKYMACLRIIDHYKALGAYQDAIHWCMKAITINEKWGEAYFELAKCYYFLASSGLDSRRNWERCAHFARHGLALPPTKTVLFVNPLERDLEIHKYLNVALNGIGDVRGALESAEQGLSVRANEESLSYNRRIYEKHLLMEDVKGKFHQLSTKNYLSEDVCKAALNILEGNPSNFSDSISKNLGLSITIYVGHGVESWNPESVKEKGIGGSETAVVEMAKRLASLGNRVTVYGHCDTGFEGIFDKVSYLDSGRYRAHECDILISSRRPEAVNDIYGVKSKATILWVHDVHCGSALTHERALKFDRILTLTNWHRDFFLHTYPYVSPNQVLVTRNGIDLTRFENPPAIRNPHRAVYSSSPDRGLQVAIQTWPRVRSQIPDAELHVYYGFDVWEACCKGDSGQMILINFLKKLIKDHEPYGVIYHGRVDQKTLADEYMGSGVWAYSTWFSESSCITAMEAQAAGLAMVTSPIAALCETVGDRGTLIPGDWLSSEYQDQWVSGVVSAMKHTSDEKRSALRKFAFENFGWDSLANDWNIMFREIIADVEKNVVPHYKAANS